MIYTARQLEDLHRGNGNGQLVLPYGARLTPLAVDWAKAKKVAIGYSNVEAPKGEVKAVNGVGSPPAAAGSAGAGTLLWWCDGPCGAVKAAVAAQGKETSVVAMEAGS